MLVLYRPTKALHANNCLIVLTAHLIQRIQGKLVYISSYMQCVTTSKQTLGEGPVLAD